MKKHRVLIGVVVFVVVFVILLFIPGGDTEYDESADTSAETSTETSANSEELRETLTNAQTLSFAYDHSDANQRTDITADGAVAGYMEEEGFFDTSWNVSTDGEKWFYVKYVTDEPINDVEGVISATTYGIYDAQDNLLGYAQQQVIEPTGLDRDYYMVFLDADGNAKPYFSDEEGSILWDADGNVIGQGDVSLSGIVDEYITITMEDGVTTEVDPWDKLCMYIRVAKELNDNY